MNHQIGFDLMERRMASNTLAVAHTAGPWRASGAIHNVSGNELWCGEVLPPSLGEYRGSVARIQSGAHIGGITNEEAAANARLIVAAPELLAALCGVVAVADRETDEFIRARAAIAAAKGGA